MLKPHCTVVLPFTFTRFSEAVNQRNVTAWQNRPLEPIYAIVYFAALWVKIRDDGLVPTRYQPIRT